MSFSEVRASLIGLLLLTNSLSYADDPCEGEYRAICVGAAIGIPAVVAIALGGSGGGGAKIFLPETPEQVRQVAEEIRKELSYSRALSAANPAPIYIADHSGGDPAEARALSEVVRLLESGAPLRAQPAIDLPAPKPGIARERLTITLVRGALSAGFATFSVLVTFHAPLHQAILSSLGLALFSGAIGYVPQKFQDFFEADRLVRRSGLARAEELGAGVYSSKKAKALAFAERQARYWFAESSFLALGWVGRIAAGIEPVSGLLGDAAGNLQTIGLAGLEGTVSQGIVDLATYSRARREKAKLDSEFVRSHADPLSARRILELADQGSRAAQSYLEAAHPEYAKSLSRTNRTRQRGLLFASAVSVASGVALLSPVPLLGHVGLGFLTATGIGLQVSEKIKAKSRCESELTEISI